MKEEENEAKKNEKFLIPLLVRKCYNYFSHFIRFFTLFEWDA